MWIKPRPLDLCSAVRGYWIVLAIFTKWMRLPIFGIGLDPMLQRKKPAAIFKNSVFWSVCHNKCQKTGKILKLAVAVEIQTEDWRVKTTSTLLKRGGLHKVYYSIAHLYSGFCRPFIFDQEPHKCNKVGAENIIRFSYYYYYMCVCMKTMQRYEKHTM